MKILSRLFFVGLFFLPLSLGAQSFVGDWKMSVPDENGNMMTIKVSIKADGTYGVDFGADGTVDINGKYESSGDQMTIWDVSGAQACNAGKGVYKYAVDGNTLTMTMVSDPCEGRGGPDGKMTWQRS